MSDLKTNKKTIATNDAIIKKTNESVAYRLGFKILQRGVTLVLSIILARLLSPAEFGVVAVAKMVVNYANSFSNFGFNVVIIQKDSINKMQINSVFTINLLISMVLALLTAYFSEEIAVFMNSPDVGPVLRWMSLYYIITSFYFMPITLLKRTIDYKILSIVDFIQSNLTSLMAIALAYLSYSYWSIVIPTLVMPAVFVLYLMYKARWLPRIVFNHQAMRGIYSFGLWNFIRNQLDLIVSKIDYFVIGRYLNVTALGIYEKSFEYTNRSLTGITKPISSVYFSTYSRLKNEPEALKSVLLQGISLLAAVSYPVLFGIVVITPHFVYSLLGDKWAPAIVPMQLLATAGVFKVLQGMFISVNVAIGKYKLQTQFNMITASVFITLCFVTVKYGIYAITASVLVYSVLGFILSFILLRRTLNLKISRLFRSFVYPLAGSVLMSGMIFFLSKKFFTDPHSIWQFFILVGIGGVIYILWILYFIKKGKVSIKLKNV